MKLRCRAATVALAGGFLVVDAAEEPIRVLDVVGDRERAATTEECARTARV
jgi:hypothetical protein